MIRLVIGLFLVFGAVGEQDFWLECHRAADCLAGPVPTISSLVLWSTVGLALMAWAAADFNKKYS